MESQRINLVNSHLEAAAGKFAKKSPDDVVIVAAVRTPLTRARKGGFKDTLQEEILAFALKGILDKTGIDPALVEDIQVGNVLPPGGGATLARMSMLYAGYPDTSSVSTVNRQCSSGLQACASIVASIQTGVIEVGIGAGVESMTSNYGPNAVPSQMSDKVLSNKQAADSLIPMGQTSENVASQFGVSREVQDKFAVASHEKASIATKNGWFKEEIVPCQVTVTGKDGAEKTVTLTQDDGIRAGTTFETLSKLRPAFKEDGTTTAGNASQVTDGAAAVLLMKRSKAQQLGLPIVGKWISFAVAGVPPHIMGIGPALAIPKALKKAGLSVNDIDIYEINEAFASQCVYSIKTLNIPFEKVNPKGGAIALGHPLGATGARQIATILPELKRTGKKLGVVSMCIGTGMGAAAVIQAE
ncbi:hypothetical protein MP228_009975 [Amoeboaphelidium protococcarum]|nr:hypothetical protein MP228_009975 [Amoeboaphelidium protococcarum]